MAGIDVSLYNLPTFNPYTFSELSAPADKYKEYYDKQEEALVDYGTKLAEVESLLSTETDPVAVLLLLNYKNILEKLVDAMLKFGLNSSIRNGNDKLKMNYARMITPIASALDKRKEEAKAQQEFIMKNPTARFSRDAGTTSLDYYLGNSTGGYDVLTGEQIEKDIATQMAPFAQKLINQPTEVKKLVSGYLLQAQHYGFSIEEIREAMRKDGFADDKNMNTAIGIIDDIIANTKNHYADNKAYDEDWALSYINSGILSGLGKDVTNNINDMDYINAYQRAQLDLSRQLLDIQRKKLDKTAKSSAISKRLGNDLVFINSEDGNLTDDLKAKISLGGTYVRSTKTGEVYRLDKDSDGDYQLYLSFDDDGNPLQVLNAVLRANLDKIYAALNSNSGSNYIYQTDTSGKASVFNITGDGLFSSPKIVNSTDVKNDDKAIYITPDDFDSNGLLTDKALEKCTRTGVFSFLKTNPSKDAIKNLYDGRLISKDLAIVFNPSSGTLVTYPIKSIRKGDRGEFNTGEAKVSNSYLDE